MNLQTRLFTLFSVAVVMFTALMGCAPASVTAPPEPTTISSPTDLPTQTLTPLPTATPSPTATSTPEPTATPEIDYPVCTPENYKDCEITLEQLNTTYSDWLDRYAQTLTFDDSLINQVPLNMWGNMIVYDWAKHKPPHFRSKNPPSIDDATAASLHIPGGSEGKLPYVVVPEIFEWKGHPNQVVKLLMRLYYYDSKGNIHYYDSPEKMKRFWELWRSSMKYLPIFFPDPNDPITAATLQRFGSDNILQRFKNFANMKSDGSPGLDINGQQMDALNVPGLNLLTDSISMTGGILK